MYLASPHASGDHLAKGERLVGQASPASAQADLEQAAHEAAGALGDIHHVARQGQALQLQLAHVRLRAAGHQPAQ